MPTIKRILCPVDFSDTAAVAAREAATLARAAGAELLLLHALEEPWLSTSGQHGYDPRVVQQYEMIARRQLDDAARRLSTLTSVRPLLVHGDPDDAIALAASTHEVDVIVMGARTRKGLQRILSDSMTERVMRKARVPVVRVSPAELRRPPMQQAHGTA